MASGAVVPGEDWEIRTPAEAGMDADALRVFSDHVGGRGCVVRNGYLIHTWGDFKRRGDVASAAKPIYAHLLFKAIELGKIGGLDERVARHEPALASLNPELANKDAAITWRHLANQVSCYGVTEPPGKAFDYSDWQMALFWDLLFTKAYESSVERVDEEVLRPLLTDPLGCQDAPTFLAFGTGDRPGRMAISPRDFCRFGLLYLRQGNWDGRPLLREEHALMAVRSPLPNEIPRTKGEEAAMLEGQRSIGGGNNQTDHLGSYSFLWWTNGTDRDGRRHWPDAPVDAYGAFGHGGQRAMVVIPSLDLVVSWNDTPIDERAKENRALGLLVAAVRDEGGSASDPGAGQTREPVPLPGQIVIDPGDPRWLVRQGGGHVFLCGPGDPEDFLYRGNRRADGTRDGDQRRLIERLAEHGANCLYLQVVRSHGGDGEADHNPFVDGDPARGLNEAVLAQWEEWFTLMDARGIVNYLFFYDDGANPWRGTGGNPDEVPAEEQAFLEAIVDRFKHHPNLIWLVAEESEEAFSSRRVQAAAKVIAAADDHGHVIGNHHHSGTTFKAWVPGSALGHFSMQLNVDDLEAVRAGAIEAVGKAAGRYQVIFAENTELENRLDFAWAAAMGGIMPMVLRLDLEDDAQLRRCGDLRRFFEHAGFQRMTPADDLAAGATRWVLAGPDGEGILFATGDGALGLKRLPVGEWTLRWIDCDTGRTIEQRVESGGGTVSWERPTNFGSRCAVSVRPVPSAAVGK